MPLLTMDEPKAHQYTVVIRRVTAFHGVLLRFQFIRIIGSERSNPGLLFFLDFDHTFASPMLLTHETIPSGAAWRVVGL